MWVMRPSAARGHAQHGWLDSYHSFSFAQYYDPDHMGFSVLRVINDDKIAPAAGFGMHGHRDMEIITYMLSGALRHEDSMGNGAVIQAGDVQRMTAGRGVQHSEVNASTDEVAHLLQIWITPDTLNLPPSYEDRTIALADKLNQWCVVASHAHHAHAGMLVHQEMTLSATVLMPKQALPVNVQAKRSAYLHVARGAVTLGDQVLTAGDAAMTGVSGDFILTATAESEVLWFDLPAI